MCSSNPHPANAGNQINFARMVYEEIQGFNFNNGHANAISEMDKGAYTDLMFCPIIRTNRGSARNHGQGRSDYSMNRYFGSNKNLSAIEPGEKEPFMTPGTAMPSTQASPTLRNGNYSPSDTAHPSFEYLNQKTLSLYIDGNVTSFTISHGASINSLINDQNNFE